MSPEEIKRLLEYCDKHFVRKGFGNHYDCKKAAAIGSAIGHNGSYLSQYDKDQEHIIYSGGKELILFNDDKRNTED